MVDDHMRTSAPGVWAAGDVIEVPHGLSMLPISGLTGSHAYSQGRTAGANAAGEDRSYDPVWIPWGFMSGDYTIGGFSIGETLAEAMGIPYLVAKGVGVSRARYFPGAARTHVKLLVEPGTLRLIGAQLHGGEGIKERCDFLAFVGKRGATLDDLAWMENIYSPPIGALFEPIQIAAQNGLAEVRRQAARAGAGMTFSDRQRAAAPALGIRPAAGCDGRDRPPPPGQDRAVRPTQGGAVLALRVRAPVPAGAVGVQAQRDAKDEDDRPGVARGRAAVSASRGAPVAPKR